MKRMLVLMTIAFLLAVGSGMTAPRPLEAQAEDPADALAAFTQAFNAYDAAAATNLVTEEFVLKIVYGTPDDPLFNGIEGLTQLVNAVRDDKFQLSVADLTVDGTRVMGTYSGEGDQIRAVGIGPEVGTIEANVENGLLTALTFTIDPEYNARFETAVAAQEQLPQTGADTRAPLLALAGLGLVVLLGGGALAARHRARA
jgi:LPXTG-motif cell wall-anchored protein